jgi:hypothetical protein
MSEAELNSADGAEPTFKEAMAAAARKSRLANGVADDAPVGAALLGSLGGVRGIVESVLPTLVFLVLHLSVGNLLLSTLVPVGVAIVFVLARVVAKAPVQSAVSGVVILAVTAGLAIVTGRAENNFVPGIIINAVFLLVTIVSLVARHPLVGVFVGLLLGERAEGWRERRSSYRALALATVVWAGMFALRVGIEVPLFLAENASGLAVAKLVLGLPLYAVVLIATWLMIRSVFPEQGSANDGESAKVS